ncbi:MAG TPA: DedA family protein [Nitrospirota bacterium]
MEAFVITYIAQFTYFGIFAFLMLTVFGFPFPEDAVLLASGVVISQGVTRLAPTLAIAYFGVLAGDMLLYYIGRKFGVKVVEHRRFGRVLTKYRLARARRWFDRWGNPLVFFGRHLVGVRAQIFLCSGVFRLHAGRVFAYDALSAFIGVPLMVGLGVLFGNNFPAIKENVMSGHWYVTGAVVLFVPCWWGVVMYKKRRGSLRDGAGHA